MNEKQELSYKEKTALLHWLICEIRFQNDSCSTGEEFAQRVFDAVDSLVAAIQGKPMDRGDMKEHFERAMALPEPLKIVALKRKNRDHPFVGKKAVVETNTLHTFEDGYDGQLSALVHIDYCGLPVTAKMSPEEIEEI